MSKEMDKEQVELPRTTHAKKGEPFGLKIYPRDGETGIKIKCIITGKIYTEREWIEIIRPWKDEEGMKHLERRLCEMNDD